MSFPSDLQGAVCNQVADCLVAVVCQRLTYYPKYGVRVPVCEVMWANGNVKSVVRSGQFAKLNTAIQTGGEDGMWTFDRYRRWADERTDWVTKREALTEDREELAPALPSAPAPRPTTPSATAPTAAPSSTGAIEIQGPDEDLDDIIQQMINRGPGTEDR